MGHLKNIANQPNLQTFPGAQFEAAGTIPPTQCTKAIIEGDNGQIFMFASEIIDPGNFTGLNLVGKFYTIISPAVPTPTQQITANTDDQVSGSVQNGINSNDTVYYIHDGIALEHIHNTQTLMNYVLTAGYAATMKGGKLYTDMPSPQLALACRILFDPLT